MSDEGTSKYDFYVQIFNSPEHCSPDGGCKICVHCAVKKAQRKSGSMKNRNSLYIGNKLIDAFHKDNSTFKTQPSDKTGYTFLCLILNQVRQ